MRCSADLASFFRVPSQAWRRLSSILATAIVAAGLLPACGVAVRRRPATSPSITIVSPPEGLSVPAGSPLFLSASVSGFPNPPNVTFVVKGRERHPVTLPAPPYEHHMFAPSYDFDITACAKAVAGEKICATRLVRVTGGDYELTAEDALVTMLNLVRPQLTLVTPHSGMIFVAPATVSISAEAIIPPAHPDAKDSTMVSVTFSVNGQQVTSLARPPYNTEVHIADPGDYVIGVVATESHQVSASVDVAIRVVKR